MYGQPMFRLLAKANNLEAQGRRILHLEMGEPYFDSPPSVVQAAYSALKLAKTHYVDSMGITELRHAVCDATEKERGFRPTLEQVLVTPANAAIYFLIRCVVNQGEEVIYPDPGFPTYYSAIRFTGTKPVPVTLKQERAFRMSPRDIRETVTDNTRLVIINSPQNPTGAVMTKEDIEEVAAIAEAADVYLLSDEVYGKITYDATHYSPALRDHCQQRTILLNSFSKAYSMTGWRLGYAIGPEEVIQKMGLLLQTIISCLPPFIQYAGITALADGEGYNQSLVSKLRQCRDAMVYGLNSLPEVSCLVPSGAFYAFPSITKTGLTSEEFAAFILEKAGVALLPGTNFGTHGEGYVRLNYAIPLEIIEEAIEKMREVL